MTFTLKSVLIAFYLSLNLAMGADLPTEVLFWKSWEQVGLDLGRVPLKLDRTVQVGAFSASSWNLNIPRVTIHAESTAPKYQIDSQKVIVLFDKLNLRVQIQSLSIDQVVERVVNGSVLRLRIQSTCSPISVTNEGVQVSALLPWRTIDNLPTPVLETMNIDWNDESWTVSELKCSGPMGIDAIFLGQLNTILKDRAFLRSLVFDKIKNEIQNQWLGFHQSLMSGTSSLLPVSPGGLLKLDRIAIWNQKGLGVLGRLLPSNSEPEFLIKFQKIKEEFSEAQKIVLPKPFVLFHAQQRIQQTQIDKINLRQNSSFMSLLRSRFLQFFLWPDLMNFRKDAQFEIGFKSFHNLTLDWKRKDSIQVGGNLNAHMFGERERTLYPYLDLAFGFSINAQIKQLGTKLEISAENPQINYKYRFNKDYSDRFSNSTHISSRIIKKAKTALVESIKIRTEIDIGDLLGTSIQLKDFQVTDDNVEIDY